MDDILLLPEGLQRKPLSKREIVLAYDDALKALDILENAGWAVLGWEPWLKISGAHVHPVVGGDFPEKQWKIGQPTSTDPHSFAAK